MLLLLMLPSNNNTYNNYITVPTKTNYYSVNFSFYTGKLVEFANYYYNKVFETTNTQNMSDFYENEDNRTKDLKSIKVIPNDPYDIV